MKIRRIIALVGIMILLACNMPSKATEPPEVITMADDRVDPEKIKDLSCARLYDFIGIFTRKLILLSILKTTTSEDSREQLEKAIGINNNLETLLTEYIAKGCDQKGDGFKKIIQLIKDANEKIDPTSTGIINIPPYPPEYEGPVVPPYPMG